MNVGKCVGVWESVWVSVEGLGSVWRSVLGVGKTVGGSEERGKG